MFISVLSASILDLPGTFSSMAKKENSFSGWLQRVRRTGEFSDVIVIVDGQEFHLHMLPLLNASVFFRNLPCSSNGYKGENSRTVEISDLPGGAESFSVAADFCYIIKPNYTMENVAGIRAVAECLGMVELLESTKKFLYTNVFSHWRCSVAVLMKYSPVGAPVDEYITSRCLKVISAACIKAFFDTKHLSAPIPVTSSGYDAWQKSPCQIFTDILVTVTSLPDQFVEELVDDLVNGEVNLNLKCRQGRNVKGWLDSTILVECKTDSARCWVLICLVKMLEKSVTSDRPWLELSSQYWCSLLEHLGCFKKRVDASMAERLEPLIDFLEHRIGGSLHELDDYLISYNFELQTLLLLVTHFNRSKEVDEKDVEEVAMEVDACLWNSLELSSISIPDFICFIEAFPPGARRSHDMLYTAVEKLVLKTAISSDQQQRLWGLIDIAKLSPACKERALDNPVFLCQPHVLQHVLQQHSEELAKMGDKGRENLRDIMQKVIRASLKLLEENSKRSKEITELQKQYAALVAGKACFDLSDSCHSSPGIVFTKPHVGGCIDTTIPDEVEEVPSDTPTRRSTCSSIEY